jgi:cell division inhibitor SepF
MSRRLSTDEYDEQETWIGRLKDRWFGETGEEEEILDESFRDPNRRTGTGTVVKLHSTRGTQISKRAPKNLGDAQKAAEDLKDRRPVIVNLEKTDDDLARRVIDFISGVTYALNGFYERVGDKVFLFTPANIVITDEDEIEPSGKGPFFDEREIQ